MTLYKVKKCFCFILLTFFMGLSFAIPAAHSSETPFVIGVSDRMGKATQALSIEIFDRFFESAGIDHEFRIKPLPRLQVDILSDEVDMLLYVGSNVTDGVIRSNHPVAYTTLMSVSRTPLDIYDTDRRGLSIWGDRIYVLTGQSESQFLEVTDTEQALRMLEANRADYFLEWDSELYQRTSEEELSALGLKAYPQKLNFDLYPIMPDTPDYRALMAQLDVWFKAQHDNGWLKATYAKYRMSSVYPYK